MRNVLVTTVLCLTMLLAGPVSGLMTPQIKDRPKDVTKLSVNDLKRMMKLYDELGNNILVTNPLEARNYAGKGLRLAEQCGDPAMKAKFYRNLGNSFIMTGMYDSSEVYLAKAKKISRSLKNKDIDAIVNLSLGTLLVRQKKPDEAMSKFIEARNVFEKNNDKKNLRRVLGNIAVIYMYRHNYDMAEKYYLESIAISTELAEHEGLGQAYSGLAKVYLEKQMLEKALAAATTSANEFSLVGEKAYESAAYKAMADIYLKNNELKNAEENAGKAYSLAKETGMTRYMADAKGVLAEIYFRKKDYRQGLFSAIESLQTDSSDQETKTFLLSVATKCQLGLGNKDDALRYFGRYQQEMDKLMNWKYQESISEMETKYQTEKKQARISELEIEKKTYGIITLTAATILLLLMFVLYFRQKNIQHKKQIAEQNLVLKEIQIQELEKERQLIAARSILKGEELERRRLANDLHDGLGGLLSGIKLKLSSMKESSIVSNDNIPHFTNAIYLLDSSIIELRRVAHNLMPETLAHYGLITALNDYVEQMKPNDLPKIRFATYGNNLRFANELELTVYRTVQELLTNAIKHANAKQIDIQLFTESNRICAQVIDNGCGFDKEQPSIKMGKGLKSIHDRTTAFNGRFEIFSQLGKGTECIVEFFII